MLKQILKNTLDRFVNPHVDRILRASGIPAVDRGTQILLAMRYRELALEAKLLPGIRQVGFRAFSQFDEDGILLYIFSLIGTHDKRCVEICAGDGIECNSANLIVNFGWQALLFDAVAANVQRGRRFYAHQINTLHNQPKFVHAWVECENTNKLIVQNGMEGEIDLLSIDVDGNDYWIWESINCVTPRVVIIEYQGGLGAARPLTVPYRKNFVSRSAEYPSGYEGASLSALVKLGRVRGYRLVGCNSCDLNAFFVRADLAQDLLPEVSINDCLKHPRSHNPERQAALAKLEWVEV